MATERAITRILFIHPDVYAFGGAEQVCVKMMAMAQRLGRVTLMHCGGELDCQRIWKWYRVDLNPTRVRFITAGYVGSLLGRTVRKPILKYALAMRYARRFAGNFDLVVGAYGECPVSARRGIQYINIPIFSSSPNVLQYLNIRHEGPLRSRLRPYYVRVSRSLSGWDAEEVLRKDTLVNSHWTAAIVRQVYGVAATVVPPSIDVELKPSALEWVNWADRELSFVMLGRIHPSKRLESGIEVIRRVRNRGYDVQLHIVGRGEDGYAVQLEQSASSLPYVHFHLNLTRPELERLVVRQKFGLHACQYEHFGIATAEMQALGCVVFAPDFAGQREVISNPEQRYIDADDAVMKVCRMLDNPTLCNHLSSEAAKAVENGRLQPFEERVGVILENVLNN